MPYVNVWVHVVWSTKDRQPLMGPEARKKIFEHIRENARKKGIHLDMIGGYAEHVHCLISLKPGNQISDCVKLLKGESTSWINKNWITGCRFSWQNDYFAASVSEDRVQVVRNYILRQEEHHKKVKFSDEFKAFLARAGFRG